LIKITKLESDFKAKIAFRIHFANPPMLSNFDDSGLLRAFPVAATRAWDTLPASVTAASSLALFRRDLKTALFTESYGCQD